MTPEQRQLIETLTLYAGDSVRKVEMLSAKGLSHLSKSLKKGIVGVQNPYAESKPKIIELLNDLLKGALKPQEFPFISGNTAER